MAKGYKQLSLEERDRITEMKSEGMSLRAMAKELGRFPSTLSRELRRNGTPAYKVYLSHEWAVKRKEGLRLNPIQRLKSNYKILFDHSGDSEDDIIAGKTLELYPIFVLAGHGKSTLSTLRDTGIKPDYVAEGLLAAALRIKENVSDE